MKITAKTRWLLLAILVAAAMLLPWAGLTLFNTKGEPREAIVAVSMLQSGNWLLPVSYGVEFPFKPPMLGWCIAALAKVLHGGVVNEYISRLPSILAAIGLVAMTYCWAARRRRPQMAAMVALVMLTCFEVARAAAICRLDMLLTFFLVGAIYMLDTEGVSRCSLCWRYVVAVALMTCATLTKGPIGACLPCFIVGVYRLWCGRGFWRTLMAMLALVVVSCLVPAWWVYSAYKVGGQPFLDLMYEENFGRLFGTMSYDSHVHSWLYNVGSIAAGMLPWTLLVVAAIVTLFVHRRQWRLTLGAARVWLTSLEPDQRLAICGAALTFIFYCIPASKRSVYLLPCYPFLTFGIVQMAVALRQRAWWTRWRMQPWVFAAAVLYMVYFAVAQPLIFNPRSNANEAAAIAEACPAGPIYTYIGDVHRRYYTLNYYLGDRLLPLENMALPPGQPAMLIATEAGAYSVRRLCPSHSVTPVESVVPFASSDKRSDTVALYRLEPRAANGPKLAKQRIKT